MERAPLPSIGSPSALTTRPSSAPPVGTERMRPVVLTWSPSLTLLTSPRSTQPTLSSSRESATPRTPPGNSSSSFIMHSSRPHTRATPSPTESTVPTLCMAALLWKPAISFSRIEVTSAGRRSMGGLVRWFSGSAAPVRQRCLVQALLQSLEAAAHRGIDHPVLDGHAHAAQELGHDLVGERDLLRDAHAHGVGELGDLGRAQRTRA